MPLTPGTRLGSYEILGPLGAGGMGEVHRARDGRLGRFVAIKTLPGAQASDPDRLARFEREARALAALSHPHVGAIYGLEQSGTVHYLVLELIEGVSLETQLASGRMPVARALQIAEQVAAAIEAAHERGIIHRDLKPANVMLTAAGVAKVVDFGLARAIETGQPDPAHSGALTQSMVPGGTVAGMILGTAAYMSPEQARGAALDARTDIWSFGCLVFEMLAGRAAFAGETTADLVAQILQGEPPWDALPGETPARVRELLRRCLRKEARDRPEHMGGVRRALAGAVAAPAGQAIAVLPFANLSGPDDEFFADGITEEIMGTLSRLPGLRVAARTSSFALKGRQEDLRQIGDKLGVTSVLEGSLRRAGSRLRITAQLVNVQDGYQLWSERYDRELTDVFAIQDEIAAAIAARFQIAPPAGAPAAHTQHGTSSLEAYELFLKGRALQLQRGRAIPLAIACFEQALALDPHYADAAAWMADSWRLLGTYGVLPAHEVMPKVRAAVDRALAQNPQHSEALATLADVQMQYDRDFSSAMATWDRLLTVDPHHVRARCERALWCSSVGRVSIETALTESARAVEDDPLNAWVRGMHAFTLGFAKRYDEGITEARRAIADDAASFLAHWMLARLLALSGRHAEALDVATGLIGLSARHPWALCALALARAGLGQTAEVEAIHDELEARARHEFVTPMWLAVAAATASRLDAAWAHAERAVTERDPTTILGPMLEEFAPLRALPGYPAWLQRCGLQSQ